MVNFTQLVLTGIMIGGIYGLVAIGFVLIYKATRIFNFAQGALLMLGAYFCWFAVEQFDFPFWVAILFTCLFAIAVGFLIERVFYAL